MNTVSTVEHCSLLAFVRFRSTLCSGAGEFLGVLLFTSDSGVKSPKFYIHFKPCPHQPKYSLLPLFYHDYQAARLGNSSLGSGRPFAFLWLLRLPDKGSLLLESLELGCVSFFST